MNPRDNIWTAPSRQRGNNRYGNKGTEKCARCRQLRRRVFFNHRIIDFQCNYDRGNASNPCQRCAYENIPCGEKLQSAHDRSLNAIHVSPPFVQQLGILAQANQRVSWVSGLEGLTTLSFGAPIRDVESSRSPTQHTLPEAGAPFLPDDIIRLLRDDFPSLSSEEA